MPQEGAHTGEKSTIYFTTYVETPTDFSAKRDGEGVVLSWAGSDPANSYVIQRRAYGASRFDPLATIKDPDAREYVDKTAAADVPYFYRIRAVLVKEGYDFYSDSVICTAAEE